MRTFNELLKESLNEGFLGIQVMDAKDAIRDLKKMGVKATKTYDDEIEINLKDRKKVHKWMANNGWEIPDIKDTYPELLK